MTKDRSRIACSLLVLVAISATSAAVNAQEKAPPLPSAESQPPGLRLGTLVHPLPVKQLTLRQQADAIPQDKKDRVHFVLINGIDPAYAANLNGVAAYFRSIGFKNTTSYQFPFTMLARKQIETVRRSDPDARIVLLGFSVGANCVRGVANNLQKENMHIDCLIYVAGDTIFDSATSRPANVGQIVNITGHGLIFYGRDIVFKGDDIDGAINRRLDARHMSIPQQRETIETIGAQLIALASKSNAAQPTAVQPAAMSRPAAVEMLRQ